MVEIRVYPPQGFSPTYLSGQPGSAKSQTFLKDDRMAKTCNKRGITLTGATPATYGGNCSTKSLRYALDSSLTHISGANCHACVPVGQAQGEPNGPDIPGRCPARGDSRRRNFWIHLTWVRVSPSEQFQASAGN
ncbi:MAG: hypothetical protein KME26_31100 [Oscillatoria princeps RMCB-10]|nr:hypothetical protein [Oscillatoria princeps RMCB-10]